MECPIFYFPGAYVEAAILPLEGDIVKHIVQVLRMQPGEALQLTDGAGKLASATIQATSKKNCEVYVDTVEIVQQREHLLHLAVAFTKNASRNEWLLEKATELGVAGIQPVISTRTERYHPKEERWNNILISAMLQSRQSYLPKLHLAKTVAEIVEDYKSTPQKLMAHCDSSSLRLSVRESLQHGKETILFIGPEGDFTKDEILLAENGGFKGVSLGNNRLRTETAAMAVCAFFNMLNS